MVRTVLRQCEADESPSEARHEVNRSRSDKLRRQRQVAFILAVFIIDHHDHASGANFIERRWHVHKRVGICHPHYCNHYRTLTCKLQVNCRYYLQFTSKNENATPIWGWRFCCNEQADYNKFVIVKIRSQNPTLRAALPECISSSCSCAPIHVSESSECIDPGSVCIPSQLVQKR